VCTPIIHIPIFCIAEWAAATLNQQHPVPARATAGIHHNQQLNSDAVAHHPPHAICRARTYYYIWREGGLPSCFTRRVLHFSTNPLFGNKYNSADNRICVCIKRLLACGQKPSRLPAPPRRKPRKTLTPLVYFGIILVK